MYNYIMYKSNGDGKVTISNNLNRCNIVKLLSPYGARACYYDFTCGMTGGYTDFPDCSYDNEEDFPIILVYNYSLKRWTPFLLEDAEVMQSVEKIYKEG